MAAHHVPCVGIGLIDNNRIKWVKLFGLPYGAEGYDVQMEFTGAGTLTVYENGKQVMQISKIPAKD